MGRRIRRVVSAAGGNPGRKHRRARVSLVTRYKVPTRFEFVSERSMDLSDGGMFIETADPVPPGTMIKVVCEMPDGSTSLEVAGVVRWWRKEPQPDLPAGMGVRFLNMDEASQKLLHEVVSSARSRSSSPPAAPAADRESSPSVAPAADRESSPSVAPAADRALQGAALNAVTDPAQHPAPAPRADGDPEAAPALVGDGEAIGQPSTAPVRDDAPGMVEAQARSGEPATSTGAPEAAEQPSAEPGETPDPVQEPRASASEGSASPEPAAQLATPSRSRGAPAAGRQTTTRALVAAGAVAFVFVLVVVAQMVQTVHRSAGPHAKVGPQGVLPGERTGSTMPESTSKHGGTSEPRSSAAGLQEREQPSSPPQREPASANGQRAADPGDRPMGAGARTEAGDVGALVAEASDKESGRYALQVITTPPGAQVVAGKRRITAPGSLVFADLSEPIRVYASKPGYRPTAATVDPSSFERHDQVAKHTLWLRLLPEKPTAKKKQGGGKPLRPGYLLGVTG